MLDAGLSPRVFEATGHVGGLWSPESRLCRPTMRTNLSKHTNCFSALSWPAGTPTFPSAAQVGDYLSLFAEKYISGGVIGLNCHVKSVARSRAGDKWTVRWNQGDTEEIAEFDFLVIACGFFAEPYTPPIPGIETFLGSVIHSTAYSSPEPFKDKHVAIIGGSLSSVEVAEDLAPYAASIHHVIPRPFWIIPKYLPLNPDDPGTTFLPLDLVLYRRRSGQQPSDSSLQARWRLVNENLRAMCGDLSSVAWKMKVDMDMPPYAAVSDLYANFIRSGRITLYKGHLTSISGSSLHISQDISLPDDITDIIFSTGFRPSSSSSILPPSLLSELEFSEKDHFLPILLHRATLHPALPNAAFVGYYRGPYWGIIELQAKWCADLFSGRLPWPSIDEMKEGIDAERKMRDFKPRMQWPRGDYVTFGTELAKTVGISLPPDPHFSKSVVEPPDVFVPSQFGSVNALDASLSKSSLEETLEKSAKENLFVAAAIFRSLQGLWQLSRTYTSRLPEYPSGPSSGTAEFIPRKSSAQSSATHRIEYLYSEKTLLTTSRGLQLQGTQQYIYQYDEDLDKLQVYFTKRDEEFALDYLFHQINISPPQGNFSPWQATSHHLCTPDTYDVAYEFHFQGSNLLTFKISYEVTGPRKDYSMETVYTRPRP